MTLVKICGITNLEDARIAVDAGADLLGFNFYPKSLRYLSPAAARTIIDQLPAKVVKVGVFVDVESPAHVVDIAQSSGVQVLQLHGDESPEYCDSLADWNVIKVLGVDSDFDVGQATRYRVNSIMLDARDQKLKGGTGRVIDWSRAKQVNNLVPKLFLAGGLSPENVTEAIRSVHPYAVDACSSIETSPGKKNHERMREFINAAHNVKP
ncbi:MAG: phosphoribosylanthranilate isomerase [Blastocatellia bacterium]|nr:MAG: phosphoribosylanthranilate isomerase [Blastocatellia bacterium]